MSPISWEISIGTAFLLGSIPTGYLIGRAKGVDIRTVGSKNIGATNVGRVFGRRAWLLCFAGDFLKGFIPVLGVGIAAGLAGDRSPAPLPALLWCGVLAATILGHMFCPWLGFKGGKGVATALGSLLAFFPLLTIPAVGALLVFLAVLKIWRFVSLASITAAACLPVFGLVLAAWGGSGLTGGQGPDRAGALVVTGVAAVLSALVIYRHRANIGRLRAGTEPQVGSKKPASAAP